MFSQDLRDGPDQRLHLFPGADGDPVVIPDPFGAEVADQNPPFLQLPVQLLPVRFRMPDKQEVGHAFRHVKAQLLQLLRGPFPVFLNPKRPLF